MRIANSKIYKIKTARPLWGHELLRLSRMSRQLSLYLIIYSLHHVVPPACTLNIQKTEPLTITS